jgi:hypothetical protein
VEPDKSEFRFAPPRALVYEVVLTGMWVVPIVIAGLAFGGALRVVILFLAAVYLVAVGVRSSRLALIVNADGVTIRNFLRTYTFAWDDVTGVGTGAILIRPALGFALNDGTVRSAEVTQDSRRTIRALRDELRPFAPASVKFVEDPVDALRTGVCPRCGERKLAPDMDGAGVRHCWGCGADIPDARADVAS